MALQTPKPNRRKRSFRRIVVFFFRDNMVEIAAGFMLVSAVILYLLFSPKLSKRPGSIGEILQLVVQPFQGARDWLVDLMTGPAMMDIVFGSIIALAIMIILLRIRYRFLYSRMWNSRSCPRCGEFIERVHRKPVDRYLAPIILPHPRRYRCPSCEWEGLRRGSVARSPS